jgi:hypothetical protein
VCISVKINQHFNNIDISHHCTEQDFEICAMQLVTKTAHVIILRKVNEFLRILDATLKYLYEQKSEFIICGDINYFNDSSQKRKTSDLFTGDIQSVTH